MGHSTSSPDRTQRGLPLPGSGRPVTHWLGTRVSTVMGHPRTTVALTVAALTFLAAGCSSDDGGTEIATPPPTAPPLASSPSTPAATQPGRTAAQYAAALKAVMPRVRRVYEVTEANDSNKLIGRPNGYTSAAVLVDRDATQCASARDGIDCGVVVEVWPNAQAAASRVSFIQGILKNAPALGSEFDYPAEAALLRVNGKVVGPSVANSYEREWRTATG